MNDFGDLPHEVERAPQAGFDILPSQKHVLEALTDRLERDGCSQALMRIELTRLKAIGESFGSGMTDAVFSATVSRMRGLLPEHALVGQVGGDGLIVAVEADSPQAMKIATALIEGSHKPIDTNGMQIDVGLVMGISVFPLDSDKLSHVLENAHAAMLDARDHSFVPVRGYDRELMRDLRARRELANDLQHAVENEELLLHYMPCVELRSGATVSVEALVRWQHPVRGLILPDEFIPVAEANGFIVELGKWVLQTACRQLRAWHLKGFVGLRVAVNLSPRQLRQHNLLEQIGKCLEEAGLAPGHLEIEMTESLLIEDSTQTLQVLRDLKKLGVHLALDDFGKGYSSLSYLKRYPFDVVKIDCAFIADITRDPDNAALTRTIINMGKSLGLDTFAEGVETEGQAALIQRYGCDRAQGWYFSPALASQDMETWLAKPLSALPKSHQGKRTLLLLDDEPNILSSLRRLLRRDGYNILTANTASEAFELLAKNEVAVIVSDQRMPEMSGTEFLSRVKELHPRTVRMVLSGYTELQSVTEAINQGAIYKFLTKPWDDDNLRANIEEAFRRLEMEEQNERLHREVGEANAALSQLNRELEARVEERTQRIVRDLNHLKVAQEILDNLPEAVIGIDEDGMVAVANTAAMMIFAEQAELLGRSAAEVLPADLQSVLEECDGRKVHTQCGLEYGSSAVWCVRMGQRSNARGKLLIVTPEGRA
jgi:EAL domain-containing protein (putative c-di-GMP-specific phosphodiesterase class I)/FixJ family two-component response regulator/GGDEF domain-containing protein